MVLIGACSGACELRFRALASGTYRAYRASKHSIAHHTYNSRLIELKLKPKTYLILVYYILNYYRVRAILCVRASLCGQTSMVGVMSRLITV